MLLPFQPRPSPVPFHLMAKPSGSKCNLDCGYCFYLEKESLYPSPHSFRMSDEVLERYIQDYISSQPTREVAFAWQGGEPTLMGLDFFRKAVELQRRHSGIKVVSNALQTNGTLLDDEWARFLAENRFLVGVSIDGPKELHDAQRVDKGRKPTFDKVMAGIECLRRRNVEFNTLTVVSDVNSRHPLEVYRFLKRIGSTFHQYIPVVERPTLPGKGLFPLADPPDLAGRGEESAIVTPWSVKPEDYGQFLVAIFDEWVKKDVGKTFVQLFDVTLGNWYGQGPGLCVFAEECGNSLIIEHNGDIYSCDHYVYPKFRLGNVGEQPLGDMVNSPKQKLFGASKSEALPAQCKSCDVRFACHGECPKHRFMRTADGEPGLNYLCPAYKRFFRHVAPYMEAMVELLDAQKAPALVMKQVSRLEGGKAPVVRRPRRLPAW